MKFLYQLLETLLRIPEAITSSLIAIFISYMAFN